MHTFTRYDECVLSLSADKSKQFCWTVCTSLFQLYGQLMRYYSYIAHLIVGSISLSAVFAQNPKIQSLLDKAKLRYVIDDDNDFKLVFDTGGERSQVVFINSNTEEFGGQTIVEIWPPAYRQPDIPDEVLLRLLSDARSRKVGAWEISQGRSNIIAVFKVKVPLSALSPAFLRSLCEAVASTADDMEKYEKYEKSDPCSSAWDHLIVSDGPFSAEFATQTHTGYIRTEIYHRRRWRLQGHLQRW